MISRYSIGKIKISKTNLSRTISFLDDCIENKNYGYVCITNARTSFLANQDVTYCAIQNKSSLTVPDGMPLVWIAHNNVFNEVGKVSGKDLMDALFSVSVKEGFSHYFYGCSKKTIDLLQIKLSTTYPGLDIKAAISPPFQPIEDYDIEALAKHVNELKPTFFWCGLGAPKQERLMALLQPHLNYTISLGVGLAFEYFAGTVKRVPQSIEKFGLEWLFRCLQQPFKARRFIIPFFWIGIKILKSKFK
jgi:N-acetylglucosaminyldiphosphoundecaprenol N-acetyl-beta-D-mannosaminyltransferase